MNRIEGTPEELIARMKAEGANSPADIFLTVDAGRIWLADKDGLLQPVHSAVLEERIPEHLRHPDGHWFGLSQRARVIFYAKDRVANPPQTYEALADPAYKGQICIRSSSNVYNLSLMSAMIANDGEAAAKAWAEGLLANLARPPEGGDSDQIKAVVSGECDIAVANTYYFFRGIGNEEPGIVEGVDNIGVVFPNQETTGTHVNIAAAGVAAHAPHPDAAISFLEYLATPEAQAYFANQNYEYPAATDATVGRGPGLLRHLQERHAEPERAGREPAEGAGDLQRDRLPLNGALVFKPLTVGAPLPRPCPAPRRRWPGRGGRPAGARCRR